MNRPRKRTCTSQTIVSLSKQLIELYGSIKNPMLHVFDLGEGDAFREFLPLIVRQGGAKVLSRPQSCEDVR